jgi:hypothetical protein
MVITSPLMNMTETKKEENKKRTSEDKEYRLREVLQDRPQETDKITKVLVNSPSEKKKRSEDSKGAKD